MSKESTRRDFLKASGLGLAAVAATGALAEVSHAANGADTTVPGALAVWVTSERRRLAHASSIAWRPATGLTADTSVALNPDKKFQEILGFGAAFTDAACYVLNQLPAPTREQLFHQLFHSSAMGLSVCRTCIGSSDYSTKLYCYDEGDPDPEMARFSIDHDREYILPILREARRANPELFLFSSPWSPPGWMKANRSMLGGCMERRYMGAYANYFLKFLQGYEAAGVPVQAVTVQNEVDTDQDGRMPACAWPQEYEVAFVREHLGPLFEQKGVNTKIWLIDHNYNLWGRAIAELETDGVRKYANAIAWHGYLGEPEWMDRVHNAFPDAEMYWTEGGAEYSDPNYARDWSKWSATFTGVLRNWCRSITAWNFALDENGRPNIGPFNCGGLVTINSQTKAITSSGLYWAFAHYSSFIRRGARRFDSQTAAKDLCHASFENPNGERVLVLTNAAPARDCEVRIGNATASIPLEADSLTTLIWR
jgi:glucosylceramidase